MHINHTLSKACQNCFDFGEFLISTPSFIGMPLIVREPIIGLKKPPFFFAASQFGKIISYLLWI